MTVNWAFSLIIVLYRLSTVRIDQPWQFLTLLRRVPQPCSSPPKKRQRGLGWVMNGRCAHFINVSLRLFIWFSPEQTRLFFAPSCRSYSKGQLINISVKKCWSIKKSWIKYGWGPRRSCRCVKWDLKWGKEVRSEEEFWSEWRHPWPCYRRQSAITAKHKTESTIQPFDF